MKYSIDFTNRFKKSLRKGVKRGLDPTLIEKAVEKLANDGKLPPSYKSHKLHGNLEGISLRFDYDILNFRKCGS